MIEYCKIIESQKDFTLVWKLLVENLEKYKERSVS